MTATLAEAHVPLLALAASNRPERPAEPLPVHDHQFRLLVTEAHPDLEYATQQHRAARETVHVWRDRISNDYVVLTMRGTGEHSVKESGTPWYDRLSRLAGMWEATTAPGGDRR
jgi:hypothetical protein